MCGRIVCNLSPEDIQQICQFVMKKKLNSLPANENLCIGKKCVKSFNISPSQITPILLCQNNKLNDEEFINNIIIQPMRWGLIPFWFKDEPENFKLSTHNAKIETIFEKVIYKNSLTKGNRCIVICQGFYEWVKKQPYFIKSTGMEDLLYLAGIYDIIETEMGQLYSYAIVTEESHGRMANIHHRSPVILHNNEEMEMWLNSENVSSKTAVKCLQSRSWLDSDLDIYPVSQLVNSSSYNDPQCIMKMEESQTKKDKKTLLTRWLIRKQDDIQEPPAKQSKLEKKMENI